MFQLPNLEEWALNSYRGYVRTYNLNNRILTRRFIYGLVSATAKELRFRTGHQPTLAEVRALEQQVIARVEAEFYGPALPPRPHGL